MERRAAQTALEDEKDAAIQALTEKYARGSLDMAAFETAVARIGAVADLPALAAESASLDIAPLPPAARQGPALEEVVELSCASSHIRKAGDWVRSRAYRLSLRSSSVRLDLSHYAGARGFLLAIDMDAASSSLRLIVPEGFEVEDRFSDRASSVVRNDPKGGEAPSNRVVLFGRLKSSVVKVKYAKAKSPPRLRGR